jgi:hypothetical protein
VQARAVRCGAVLTPAPKLHHAALPLAYLDRCHAGPTEHGKDSSMRMHLALLTAFLWPGGQLQSAERLCVTAAPGMPARQTTTLRLRVTVDARLPASARTGLCREAASIWRSAGVELDWASGSAELAADGRTLRLLVVERPGAPSRAGSFAVAELIRLDGGAAVAIASIDRARQVVENTTGTSPLRPARWDDNLVGVVLGRAIAHEIGHFLLSTQTHAKHGLMRAQFSPHEFTDLRSTTFALDAEAAAWLANRARPAIWPAASQAGSRFSYAR